MPAPIDLLVAATTAAAAGSDEAEALRAISSWKAATWRKALLDLPLDERGFHDRFLCRRRDALVGLWRWWTDREPESAVPSAAAGFLGFYLLTLVAMYCSDRTRYYGEPAGSVVLAGIDAAAMSRRLVKDDRVRKAIEALYHPRLGHGKGAGAGPAPSTRTLKHWDAIDFTSLKFHRHGTTSIILSCERKDTEDGDTATLAFKCLIYPYLKLPAIAAATRSYAEEYGKRASPDSPLVAVRASHGSWILMGFLKGQTLAERLRERPANRPGKTVIRPIDLAELEQLGTALLYALTKLEEEGHHHDDLTPSNIIVQDEGDLGKVRIRLIDLGVNHLHTRTLSGASEGEADYVAPEVRTEGAGDDRADLYSLGVLLLAISGTCLNPDGTLPDHTYILSVGLARLLEDLVDADPDRRLLVTPVDPGKNRYEQIGTQFQNEMEVVRESARLAPVGWLEKLKGVSPGAGTVARQGRILEVRKHQKANSAHLHRAKRLVRWAWLASILLWATAAIVMMWWARDLGIAWQAKWLELLNNLFNRSGDGMVFFDDIRAADYPIPDPWGNLPARIVGASFTLVSARLYLNVFAELSPMSSLPRKGMLRFRTLATEGALRAFAVVPALCVLVPTLVQRDWWPLSTQVGLVTTAILVSLCVWFQRDTHRRARAAGMSTVPKVEVPPGRLGQWQPTLLLYCVPILGIGTLIMLDVLQDELVYAGFVSLINIAIYYFKSAGTDAPLVRTEMSRAFLAAERLDHLDAREKAKAPQPRSTAESARPLVDA